MTECDDEISTVAAALVGVNVVVAAAAVSGTEEISAVWGSC